MRLLLSFLLCALVFSGKAQSYTSSSIFAHNDYVHPIPFYTSYFKELGFIETDIFLQDGKLLVAHSLQEIKQDRTLEELYLKPLLKKIDENHGFAYSDHAKTLTLMVDLKTSGEPTLNALVALLNNYPKLISCSSLFVTISGDVPAPTHWNQYPSFIHFDGRPGVTYTTDQLARVRLISGSFTSFSQWNGKGVIPAAELAKITDVIKSVHTKEKPIRFWAIPDFTNAWIKLMELNVDILNTDDVLGLSTFIENTSKSTYTNTELHLPYKKTSQIQKKTVPKNIILMIGDGMGLTQMYSGYTANQGNLNIFNMQDIGFSVTTSSDSYITDSAAGATAMATGSKTNNRFIGVDAAGKALPSITEKLKQKGFKTAIISNGDITDATPAAFYAHQPERSLSEAIALDFLAGSNDILIGGGTKSFNKRLDKRDLLTELSKKGYTTATTFNALDTIRNKKFVVLDDAAVVSKINGRGDFLSRSLTKSISMLEPGSAPFFIMTEGAQIDYGGHDNNMEYVVREMLDFDKAVGEAMKFVDADGETLLIVTADHETGGLTLVGGNISTGAVRGSFSTNDHTSVMVPVFSYGSGSEFFKGVYQNTELYTKILEMIK